MNAKPYLIFSSQWEFCRHSKRSFTWWFKWVGLEERVKLLQYHSPPSPPHSYLFYGVLFREVWIKVAKSWTSQGDSGWCSQNWGSRTWVSYKLPFPSPHLPYSYPFTPKLQCIVPQVLNLINTGLNPHGIWQISWGNDSVRRNRRGEHVGQWWCWPLSKNTKAAPWASTPLPT